MPVPDWSRAHGPTLFAAIIRQEPDDFFVDESLGFDLSGDGEHDYLRIEKAATNTEWLARQMAAFAEVPARDVGYSGLKDRHAVTRQWFSVPRWHSPDWTKLEIEGVSVLELKRHQRKLRRGSHRFNRFRIVMRGDLAGAADIDVRLAAIAKAGVPNYFGEQRFGRGGSNLALVEQWAGGKRLPRHKRSIAISSARSYLFNCSLAERVEQQTWNRVLPGDVVNLDGSGSVFTATDVDSDLERRCQELDIHPAGVLWGEGAAMETVAEDRRHWCAALTSARVQPAHRALRLRLQDFSWAMDEASLTLDFSLRRGSFATAVLREIATVSDVRG
jgi:tRNA pseudouridine13 synthase